MRFYRETGVASASVQAVGASLQVGSTIWGVAPNSWFQPGGRSNIGPNRKVRGPMARVVINAPDYQRGVHTVFELRTRWFVIKRIGRGIYEDYDRSSVGWYAARKMCSGVNI